jgi:hypothetical protein
LRIVQENAEIVAKAGEQIGLRWHVHSRSFRGMLKARTRKFINHEP